MSNLIPMPVPDIVRTAYIHAHAKERALERRYCQLLEDIAKAQAERARKQRKTMPAPSILLPTPELPTPAGLGWQPLWEFTFNGDIAIAA